MFFNAFGNYNFFTRSAENITSLRFLQKSSRVGCSSFVSAADGGSRVPTELIPELDCLWCTSCYSIMSGINTNGSRALSDPLISIVSSFAVVTHE